MSRFDFSRKTIHKNVPHLKPYLPMVYPIVDGLDGLSSNNPAGDFGKIRLILFLSSFLTNFSGNNVSNHPDIPN